MIERNDVYRIGKIKKAHGLKGEVVFVFDDDIFDRVDCEYLICDVDGILVPFFIEEYRFRSDSSALVKFDDIDSVEQTSQILGCDVYFERKYVENNDDLSIEEDDGEEFSLYYFVGFDIIADTKTIGKIESVDDSTQNWLFVLDNGTFIPANGDFITDINQEKRTITMDLPDGLLDLNK